MLQLYKLCYDLGQYRSQQKIENCINNKINHRRSTKNKIFEQLINDPQKLREVAAQIDPQHPDQQAYLIKTVLQQQGSNGKSKEQNIFRKLFKDNLKSRTYLLNHPSFKHILAQPEAQSEASKLGYRVEDQNEEHQVQVLQNLHRNNKFNDILQREYDGHEHNGDRRLLLSGWTGKNWTSLISNTVQVSYLSIFGTHDSSAYSSPDAFSNLISSVWKTQDLTFTQQLNYGARYLDMRVKCNPNEVIGLYHGTIYLGPFSKATGPIETFMRANPTQFLIIMFQKEQGSDDANTCGQKVLNQFFTQTHNLIKYCYSCNPGVMPTVGDLRGKVWLIQANGDINLNGELIVDTAHANYITTDNTMYFNEIYWNGPVADKQAAALVVINKPKTYLRLSFMSISSSIRSNAATMNTWLRNQISTNSLTQIGTILCDFPQNSTISAIISSNL